MLQRESWDDLHGKHVFENYFWIFTHSTLNLFPEEITNWFNVAPVRRTQTTDGLKVYFVSLSVYCFRLKTQGWKTISSYCWPESCTQCYMGQKFHVDQSWNCLCNDCEAAVSILLVFTAKGQSEQRKRIWPQETNKKWKHPKESICFKALKWAEHVVVLNIQKRLLWFL